MKKMRPGVKALIIDDGKVLVVHEHIHREDNILDIADFPGGGVDFGENPYDTLVREVMEETGLSIKILKPIGLFWFFRYDGDQVICTTFLCEADNYNVDTTKNPMDDESIVEHSWVTKEEFLSAEYNVGHESLKQLFASL